MLIAQRRLQIFLELRRCPWSRFHRGLAHAHHRQITEDFLALRWRRVILRLRAKHDWIVDISVRPHWNYAQWTSELLALRWRRSVLRLLDRIERIDQLLWDMDFLFLRWHRLAYRCKMRNHRIERSILRALWQLTCPRRRTMQMQTPANDADIQS